jgi:hypothetical protein
MKLANSFIKLIVFLVVFSLSSRFIEGFIINAHYSMIAIVGGIVFESFFVYTMYRMILE